MTAYAVSNEIYGKTIRSMRKRLGLTQAELASLANVSVETIDQWESATEAITGPIVTLVRIFNEYPQIVENMVIPENPYPLRLWYMRDNEVCTIIDVDERLRKVKVHNYTTDYISRAFRHFIKDRSSFFTIITRLNFIDYSSPADIILLNVH